MLFFLLPVGVDYQARRLPMVTFSIMGVCVLVHLWSMGLYFSGEKFYSWWMDTFWFTPAYFSVLTVFTSMFVHADIFHLLGNMVFLFLFGASTEDRIGRVQFSFLYFLGGIAAAFMHVAFTPGHFAAQVPMGGASGAISACMGAFFLLFPKMKVEFKYFGLFFFRPFSGDFFIKAWIVMSFWFLRDLFWGVLEMTVREEAGGGTAFGAHVGGFLLGMGAVGMLKLWWRSHPQPEDEEAEDDQEVEGVAHRQQAALQHTQVQAQAIPVQKPVVRRIVRPTDAAPFIIHQYDQDYGPYTRQEVLNYKDDGSIIPQALYWREGMDAWRSIDEFESANADTSTTQF